MGTRTSINIHQVKKIDVGKKEGREFGAETQRMEITDKNGNYFDITLFFD